MNDAELLQEVKDYLRISGTSTDPILEPLIQAGKDYIKGSTGREFSYLPLEILCLKMLLLSWFDGNNQPIPYGVQSILRHLELQQ